MNKMLLVNTGILLSIVRAQLSHQGPGITSAKKRNVSLDLVPDKLGSRSVIEVGK